MSLSDCLHAWPWCWMTTDAMHDEAVHDFLSQLMRHWPQRLHLVLISRSSPPWPLANLRAKGQVVEIRTREFNVSRR